MAEWRSGGVTEWRSGGVAEWRGGGGDGKAVWRWSGVDVVSVEDDGDGRRCMGKAGIARSVSERSGDDVGDGCREVEK